MKKLVQFALAFVVMGLSGCGSANSNQSARRAPLWVGPTATAVASAPAGAPVAATNSSPRAETLQVPAAAAPPNANTPAQRTNAPPVANVLSLANIKEMTAKGVSEQTILNVLRSSRALYTLTTQEITDLQEAKASRGVIDYLLSTPLLYQDDLLRSGAYYYYAPLYPGYWHGSFHDAHHDVHHFDSGHSYGHVSHDGGRNH